ncbi:unnamed protein product [Eruca vesicaria subsp. sativa]|uniref:Protein kinase domain-containing protein n=1 Tax=Eruca vesicaria subsp. sativa TaxID=29727 RepID=A0ABC8KRI4_ERUVS|nr:unnamed protein product [Eruca vesicaria subsp. sativa]
MARILSLLFLVASHLLVSGVTSKNLTIENKCDYTVWPGIFTSKGSLSTTGFALKKGASRAIDAPSLWSGKIWGRTLCSRNSTGKFSCRTGDCGSGEMVCSGKDTNSPTTVAELSINSVEASIDSYRVSVAYGYNLPLLVLPQGRFMTNSCKVVGCHGGIDLNQACPYELRVVDAEERPIACTNPCLTTPTTCKKSPYSVIFKSECPTIVTSGDNDNNNFTCLGYYTDYVITFCPFFTPAPTRRKNTSPVTESSLTRKKKNETLESPKEATTGSKRNSPLKLKVILGSLAALVVMIIIVVTAIVVRAKSARRKNDLNRENIEAIVMLKRYSYGKVKKMTKSFAHVLGKGGFGTVYKGKLPDGSGRDVAVKILKDLKGNGEEFINEVASMSRTSHVNIVSLLGFCYEGSKRAIIYEYMPNGSLDKFISESMSTKIEWKALYRIAEGVARGLEYLHNRCVSRIVHFDIKPQNILMDEDFCPKISDFGLAKLCKKKDSIISMLDARGTIGYIAPEVFSKSLGGVSHKSDVYSYGMVVLEIAGAKNREIPENSRSNSSSSSIYFPDWIYKDLEREDSMTLFGDKVTEEEDKIVKKMVLVGLWCIQTNPSDRPSMSKVVEMLEGSLEALHIPPKPLLGLPAVMVSESESQETSNLWKASQSERGPLSP